MTTVALSEAPPAVPVAGPRPGDEILSPNALAGFDPAELATRYGTPAYLYDFDCIERRSSALRAALPERVDIAYAVKANPALAVVDLLGRLGAGADVASGGELATALAAGVDPRRIVMTGPGKRDDELAAARPGDVARVSVMLRLAVRDGAGIERTRLVGDDGAGKFGMELADVREGAGRIARSRHLRLVGLHAFGASNVLDVKQLGGRTVAIVDGGIHHVLRPALVRQEHRVVAFPASSTANARQEGHPPRPVTIAGPLCSGLDLLARNVRCGDLDVGTLVAVLDVGAYGFTESMPLFLSHAVPPEIAIRGGRAEVIRPRQEPEDRLRCQRVPDW